MKTCCERRTQVAATETDAPVLLQGESGTGKEVVSRFIHARSPRLRTVRGDQLRRPAGPSLESELFGYERGASRAPRCQPGQIELASNGVLFLDEVTEMSAASQAKLPRVLQSEEFSGLVARVC